MQEEHPAGTGELEGAFSGGFAFYEHVLDVMNDSIKIVSQDRRILFVNEAAASLLDRSKESLVGTKCHEEFGGFPDPCDFCRIDEVFGTGRVKRYASWIGKSDGTERFMEFSIYPVKGTDDSVRWVVEITRDLTDSRRMADKIAFQEKLGILGGIAARVADEMKNPLSAILTASKVFTDSGGELSASDRETIGRILREEGLRVQGLLQDFLSVGCRRPPIRVFLDPAEVLEEVVSAMRQSPSCSEGIELQVGPLLKGRRIFADAEQIKQALWNILANAIEAMEGKGRVSLGMEEQDDAVLWVVQDAGRGIGREDLASIFEPFWSTRKGSRGLGLTIAKNVVEMHGGGIDVQSQPGEGTRVLLRLPVGK